MTYEGEIPKSLIFMHHNSLILNVPVINEKLPYGRTVTQQTTLFILALLLGYSAHIVYSKSQPFFVLRT